MMEAPAFLVFRLSGPMAAFGAPAVGEQRPVDDRPTRSGVLGLVGACLGIDRSDEDALLALTEDSSVAVRNDEAGSLLLDFHTVQAPRLAKKPFATRQEELKAAKLSTVISYREYRSGSTATVVLTTKGERVPGVEAIANALRNPVYAPYLGRRSCPVGEPFWPLVVHTADCVEAALDAYDEARPRPADGGRTQASSPDLQGRRLGSDADMVRNANKTISERRRDRLTSPRNRHLGLREEIVASWFGGSK